MRVVRAAQAGQGGAVRIACINKAKTPLGVDFDKLTATLQKCYDQFFVPVWGYPVTLYNTTKAKPSDWQFIYFDDDDDDDDDADAANALGYHDLTKDGQPVSKIFVRTTIDDGEKVSVTACHELFEMAIDPVANLWAQASDGAEYAYEMCDPVEENTFDVDGVAMSNFVHPAWFEPFKYPPGAKYDHLGKLKAPYSMTKGGYMIIMKNGKVSQKMGSEAKKKRFAKEDRWGHCSEYRKPDGKRLGKKYDQWLRASGGQKA
jgi:hypothetical protein